MNAVSMWFLRLFLHMWGESEDDSTFLVESLPFSIKICTKVLVFVSINDWNMFGEGGKIAIHSNKYMFLYH